MGISLTVQMIIPAILGGFLPTFVWLWFWLYQDRKHPEPKGLLAITFVLGMLIVFIAMYLEGLVLRTSLNNSVVIIINSIIEEVLKLGIPAIFLFKAKSLDEPVDYAVYLITAALGFAAFENFLFLLNVSSTGMIHSVIGISSLRFVGATVLHAVTAAAMGLSIGWNYYKSNFIKWRAAIVGLCTASFLHMAFNLIIMKGSILHITFIHAIMWTLIAVTIVLINRMIERNEKQLKHTH